MKNIEESRPDFTKNWLNEKNHFEILASEISMKWKNGRELRKCELTNSPRTASPRAKAKVKARARENIQEKGSTTRTRLDLRMKMDSARWVFLVKNVKELNLSVMSKRMMILIVPVWIEQLLCFAFESATVFQWIRQNCRVGRRESVMRMRSQRALMKNSISQRERCFSPLDVEMIDQMSTLEVLCPRVQWIDYATSVPTEKVQYSMNLESVLGESLQHYGIKRNVLFTNRSGSSMNFNVHKAAAMA